jgi:hypothetical protein
LELETRNFDFETAMNESHKNDDRRPDNMFIVPYSVWFSRQISNKHRHHFSLDHTKLRSHITHTKGRENGTTKHNAKINWKLSKRAASAEQRRSLKTSGSPEIKFHTAIFNPPPLV